MYDNRLLSLLRGWAAFPQQRGYKFTLKMGVMPKTSYEQV